MTQKVFAGLVLAVASAALFFIGDGLGWDLDGVLFLGVGVGGALGLIPDGSPLGRLGGFALGLLAASIVYGVRALLLPDSTVGRAVAVLLVVALAVGFVLLTFGRAPLWSALLGIGAMGGAFEVAFTDSPGSVLSTLPVALTSLLTMVAVGFASTVFFAEPSQAAEPRGKHATSEGPPDGDPAQEVSLDEVLTTGRN